MSKFTVNGTDFNFYKINDNKMVHYHLYQNDEFNKIPDKYNRKFLKIYVIITWTKNCAV